VVGIREALANLKKAIMSSPGEGGATLLADRETTDFLYNWLKNNKASYNSSAQVSLRMSYGGGGACCGSGMFYPGSENFSSRISAPGSRILRSM
jgi:hypothetical protein